MTRIGWLAVVTAALALTVATSALGGGHEGNGKGKQHARWHSLSLEQKRNVVAAAVKKERTTVRWWVTHRGRMTANARVPLVYCRAIGIRAPGAVCAKAQRLIKDLRLLRRIDAKIAAARAAQLLASFPPHHALWMCIHAGEGRWDDPNSGGNGHWGGLQMTPGWGGLFTGTADHYSQAQQEWFAETGYRRSGYSRSWLQGQWGQTIGPCWRFAA